MPQWTAGAHAEANWGGSTNAVTKDCPADEVRTRRCSPPTSTPQQRAGGGREARDRERRRARPVPGLAARASVPEFGSAVPDFTGQVNAVFAANSAGRADQLRVEPVGHRVRQLHHRPDPAAAAGKESWTKALQVAQQQLVAYAKDAGYPVQG